MQYNCDSILIRALLIKYRSAWSQAIFRGVFRDVRYFMGGPRCVTKCDRGRGCQNWPKIAWRTLWTAPLAFYHPVVQNSDIHHLAVCDIVILAFCHIFIYLSSTKYKTNEQWLICTSQHANLIVSTKTSGETRSKCTRQSQSHIYIAPL